MKIEILSSPQAFRDRAWDFLLTHEAQHNLLLGITGNLLQKPSAQDMPEEKRPLFCVAEEEGQLLSVALMTPPFRMVLSGGSPTVMKKMAEEIHTRELRLPGVLGPNQAAECFAQAFTQRSGQRVEAGRSERIYQLTPETITPPSTMPAGELTEADPTYVDRLADWFEAFKRDVFDDAVLDAQTHIQTALRDRRLYLWMTPHNQPVSMAASTGPTPNGIRVGIVYTPPEYRQHGYASAAVWALSQHLLATGKKLCFLFTDLANPTSNSIYQKIGYRPVCDFQEWHFR